MTLLPTLFQETFSGVAVESLLSGTPVISTRKGNLPNLVKDGISGKIIDKLSRIEWEETIKEWSQKRVDRDYAENLRKELNSKKHIGKIIEIFDSIIGNRINKEVEDKEVEDIKDEIPQAVFVETKETKETKEMKKKIVFGAKFFYPPLGGGEYFIHSVLTNLKSRGYSCEAFCYCHPDPKVKFGVNDIVDWMGIKVYRYPIMSYGVAKKFFLDSKPDLFITQSYDAPNLVRIAKECGIKVIYGDCFWRNILEVDDNFTNMLERPLESVKIRKDLHRVWTDADDVYVNSEYMKEAVKKYVGIDVEKVICPVLQRDRVCGGVRNPKYITLINPDVGKGGKLFLYLSQILKNREFLCVGLGNEFSQDNAWINREIKKRENIKIIEKTDDMRTVYAESKVVLVPSLVDETFSMVVLESLANGVPVIASPYGNLKFLLTKGGFILEPSHVDEWVDKIELLFSDDELYQKTSAEGIERSQDFNPEDQLNKFYEMVKNLIGESV